jgi:predicted N-acetyltransferase YhbS
MSTRHAPSGHRAAAPVIRPAATPDVPALRRIIAAAFRQYDAVLPPALFDAYLEDLLAVEERLDEAEVLVAEVAGEPVGTVAYYPDGAATGLGWPSGWPIFRALAVVPERRSRGTGHALVATCVDRASSAGAPAIGLHTAWFMTAALALYERWGFVRAPELDITPADVLGDVLGDLGDSDERELPRVIAYRLGLDPIAPARP